MRLRKLIEVHSMLSMAEEAGAARSVCFDVLCAAPLNRLRLFYYIRRFLSNHDRGSVGVATDNCGHDGGINHAQTCDPMHTQVCIDHSQGIATHFAGADRMIERLAVFADLLHELVIALAGTAHDGLAAIGSKSPGLRQFNSGS